MSIIEQFKLDKKNAIITGGAQGIGEAFALALASAGANVAIVDINEVLATEVVSKIISMGRKSIFVEANVSIPKEIKNCINEIKNRWGKIDIAINNAGVSKTLNATDVTEQDWNYIVDLDLKGVFFCCKEEASGMIPNGYGKIINTASISAYMTSNLQFESPYNAAKAGVVQLTRSLAAEWGSYGIRVNSISPGYMNTPILQEVLSKEELNKYLPQWINRTALKKMGIVEYLKGPIVFLSSEASDYMTGADLIVDGGYLIY